MRHFDLCVIGSGSGNSIIDEHFADLSVALVDKGERFGGTCLNAGCIPTKMFVYPADLARTPERAGRVGVQVNQATAHWAAIRERVFGRIDPISEGGERWREENDNVTLYRQAARFTAPRTLQVGDETITADSFVIAAGSRPRILELPGADDPQVKERIHTSETIMRLPDLPSSLVILGGGFIAAEFAHVFSAFGTKVTLIHRGEELLKRHDEAVRRRFTDTMAERVTLRLRQTLVDFEAAPRGGVVIGTRDERGMEYCFEGEQVLMALGRIPNGDTLNLEAAGVQLNDDGLVVVDEYQRTTAEGVFALGDASSPWQLKHVANHEARVVQHNLLHPDELVASDHRFVPCAVFSDPQIATVGLTEQQARDQDIDYVTAVQEYGSVAYGWAMEDTGHFVKLLADRSSRQLIGAHILGPDAAILIQPIIQAMSFGLDAPTMARGQYWIHPALAEVVENALLALPFDA